MSVHVKWYVGGQQAYIVGLGEGEGKSDALDPTSSSSRVGLQLSSWDDAKLFLEIRFASFSTQILVVFVTVTFARLGAVLSAIILFIAFV